MALVRGPRGLRVARQLGDEAAVDARTLAELERALRRSGYLRRTSDGQLTLSPKAMRQLGKALLKDVADRMSSRAGARDQRQAGAAGELSGASREWVFGDSQPWDRTVTNAVLRTVSEGSTPGRVKTSGAEPSGIPESSPATARELAGPDSPGSTHKGIRLDIRDVEVAETESRTRAPVAPFADTSVSMAMDGRWVPMKRTALALHHLIRTRFRGDDLELIGFGRTAQEMGIEELTALDAFWDKGTNLHHALLLANRFFRKHPNEQPVLLIVTDGEPTAHLMSSGETWFAYPPSPQTIGATILELDASGRLGARVTFFRLGEDARLARFVDKMAHRVDGRVVAPGVDDLRVAVIGSYLGDRGPSGYGGLDGYRSMWGWGDRGDWV